MGQPGVILLDTHVALWLALEPGQISARAHAAIDAARADGTGLAICDISLAEIATAYAKHRFTLTVPLDSFLDATESRFKVFPITARVCARTVTLPASYPRDPADRLIAATALVHGLSLVTADRSIRKSRAVPTIW